ncbi:4562_t:CDS:2 [Cetraspora pellucida]|uniref:4562_t:CDS:1 n=1 Tax=Cetraspora pellucida TaxID=1433469 RepID=A0A9N9DJ18_9GLOM|nr:4562_t:CDS:2 [Cetraspora pellucida]
MKENVDTINNPNKDYYTYYQVARGGLESFELFINCVKQEKAYTINKFKNLKVTDSLRFKESVIIEAINSKFRNHRKHKNDINHIESQKQVKIDPEELNEPESITSSLSLL